MFWTPPSIPWLTLCLWFIWLGTASWNFLVTSSECQRKSLLEDMLCTFQPLAKRDLGDHVLHTLIMYKDCLGIMKEQCKNSRLPHLLMIVVHGETLWRLLRSRWMMMNCVFKVSEKHTIITHFYKPFKKHTLVLDFCCFLTPWTWNGTLRVPFRENLPLFHVFVLEHEIYLQWRNFARGCPWARDGWVPHWLRSACAKCKKIEARIVREPWGVGSRGPFKGPVGSRSKAPGGGPGGEPPEAPVHSNADTAFPTQTYIRHWDC